MNRSTRRRLLQGLGALSVASLAGCSVLSENSTPTPTPEYEALEETPTYRGDDVGLSLPEAVPRADSTAEAALIVVHGNPSVEADQAVSWLDDGRVVALLGDAAAETWRGWTSSDAYAEAFDDRGRAESDPAPHLLVAGAGEDTVRTNRFSWADLPSNAELLQSLDEAVADIAAWRST
jgi:hypothetical protein